MSFPHVWFDNILRYLSNAYITVLVLTTYEICKFLHLGLVSGLAFRQQAWAHYAKLMQPQCNLGSIGA